MALPLALRNSNLATCVAFVGLVIYPLKTRTGLPSDGAFNRLNPAMTVTATRPRRMRDRAFIVRVYAMPPNVPDQ
jgi:hypothetical protein